MTYHVGDYVWYERFGLTPGSPSQIVDVITDGRFDGLIRSLTGCQEPVKVYTTDLEPMNDLELLAICGAWGDSIIL